MPTNSHKPSIARTLLVLGRISNLPTVWSNCLAGWLLGGGGEWPRLLWLCAGASLLYVGGMFLNDACDLRFDKMHRSERPIPSGAIQERTVWILSFIWLVGGALILLLLASNAALATLGLLGCIVMYDIVHKKTVFAPILMGGCRLLLYIVAAQSAGSAITANLLWSAGALALYVIGLSYLARKESGQARINPWSLLFLLAPVVIACVLNGLPMNLKAALIVLALAAWIAWCIRLALSRNDGAIGRAVSGLLAGIVLVDVLAVQNSTATMLAAFFLLFCAALFLQRLIPAT